MKPDGLVLMLKETEVKAVPPAGEKSVVIEKGTTQCAARIAIRAAQLHLDEVRTLAQRRH